MGYFFTVVIALFYLLAGSRGSSFDSQLNQITGPYVFNIAGWEVSTLVHELLDAAPEEGDASTVVEYFKLTEQANLLEYRLEWAITASPEEIADIQSELDQLRGQRKLIQEAVERVLEKQIRDMYVEQDIFSPWPGFKVSFPPVKFKLTEPPKLLIISPRERIENTGETMLQPDIKIEDIEEIENRVDQLGVSSLVTDIGGLGATYPAFVANDMSLQNTINAAAEEWLHQYLAFTPLGFRYVLDSVGLVPDYDVARMNETLAGIVSKEIGGLVYDRYYRVFFTEGSEGEESGISSGPVFDFYAEMREIRRQVDLSLSQGQVEEAEQFMNEKRDYLAENGYYIRKLNQAYFAFHGTYADSPTSIDPIGTEMKLLRAESRSLKEFLDDISAMTNLQELTEAAGG
jgi:hypothetical protein